MDAGREKRHHDVANVTSAEYIGVTRTMPAVDSPRAHAAGSTAKKTSDGLWQYYIKFQTISKKCLLKILVGNPCIGGH